MTGEQIHGAERQRGVAPAEAVLPEATTGKPRRRVLLIAFDFPPRRTSGVYRPTALTKYLPAFGWQPTVLTIRDPKALEDASLLAKIPPDVKVVSTPYLRITGWEDFLHRGVRSLGALRPAGNGNVVGGAGGDGAPGTNSGSAVDAVLRAAAGAVRSALYFPDASAGWIPIGLPAALKLAMGEHFDAVYTTHPPRAAHVIGLLLNKLCGIPWVAEFRDPWMLPENEQPIFDHQVPAPRRNKWLHARVLSRASAIVTVTTRHADELQRVFGVPAEKLAVISNGFDEDDSHEEPTGDVRAIYPPGYVHLSHFGTVYKDFSGQFFPALAELLRERPELRRIVRVHVIGFPDEQTSAFVEGELSGIAESRPFLPHGDALEAMRRSDVLLLFYGHDYTSRASIPGKLYEYLRSGQPVLGIAYPGGVKDLIERAGCGWVHPPNDIAGIKKTLATIVAHKQNGNPLPRPDPATVAQYRYDFLAQRLAEVLERVAVKR